MLTTKEILAKYGKPGEDSLVTINLPFPMRVAWDVKTKITKMRCHSLIADKLKNVLQQLLDAYGYEKIQALGIDLYGGCYNYRKMRGGSDWSRHSWGIAIDLNPDVNQLKWTKDKAAFARPEYKLLIDIFYKNGFVNQGIEKGYDWMHFEIKN